MNSKLFKNRQFIKLSSDITSLLVVGLPILILNQWVEPFHRGFNCDDESILYPFHDDTVTVAMLVIMCLVVPVLVMIAIEVTWYKLHSKTDIFKASIFYWKIYDRVVIFLFGVLASELITETTKYTIGRLRPHFIDVCNPKLPDGVVFKLDDESRTICAQNYTLKYITDYVCANPNYDWSLKNARLSFMSGHSSISAFAMVYLTIYLQTRLQWRTLGLVKPLSQVLCLFFAVYTGMSRISDYKHHWSDVLIGQVQGTVSAVLVTLFLSDFFDDTISSEFFIRHKHSRSSESFIVGSNLNLTIENNQTIKRRSELNLTGSRPFYNSCEV